MGPESFARLRPKAHVTAIIRRAANLAHDPFRAIEPHRRREHHTSACSVHRRQLRHGRSKPWRQVEARRAESTFEENRRIPPQCGCFQPSFPQFSGNAYVVGPQSDESVPGPADVLDFNLIEFKLATHAITCLHDYALVAIVGHTIDLHNIARQRSFPVTAERRHHCRGLRRSTPFLRVCRGLASWAGRIDNDGEPPVKAFSRPAPPELAGRPRPTSPLACSPSRADGVRLRSAVRDVRSWCRRARLSSSGQVRLAAM